MYEAGKLNRKGSPLRVTEYVETPSSSGNLNHKWLEARYLEKVSCMLPWFLLFHRYPLLTAVGDRQFD